MKGSQQNILESGTAIYVPDPYYIWLPAVLEAPVEEGDATAAVKIALPADWEESTAHSPDHAVENESQRTVDLALYNPPEPNEVIKPKKKGKKMLKKSASTRKESKLDRSKIPRVNLPDPNGRTNQSDMADLRHLHLAAVLYNIKDRHVKQMPYTRVGDIIVAVNPYQWLSDLYSEESKKSYADKIIWNCPSQNNTEEEKCRETNASPKLTTKHSGLLEDIRKPGHEPHIYEVSSLAYKELSTKLQNQTILVSGVSGAGKTVSVKVLMTHLSQLEGTRPGNNNDEATEKLGGQQPKNADVIAKIVESNPIFEAFGNAKTTRNDNSSRFGKFQRLQFEVDGIDNFAAASAALADNPKPKKEEDVTVPITRMAGSVCVSYLLEKSRVTNHSVGERGYHIFYQLFAAPEFFRTSIWKEGFPSGTKSIDFKYLIVGGDGVASGDEAIDKVDTIPGMLDSESWKETIHALELFGISGAKLTTLMQALCVVLQLGNIVFDSDPELHFDNSFVSNRDEFEKLANLIGVDEKEIETAFTNQVLVTRGTSVTKKLSPRKAKDACDAFAKEIYFRLFERLVRVINEETDANRKGLSDNRGKSSGSFGYISLLDIFGFENFAVNKFEQLCINYANERLQSRYVDDNFTALTEEYAEEELDVSNMFDYSLVDNSNVMDLLGGKIGLIVALNEECVRLNGSDESFAYKIKIVHEMTPSLVNDKLQGKTEFAIRHYADTVTYDADKFVERNTDKLPQSLVDIGCKSSNALIKEEFLALGKELSAIKSGPPKKRTAHTVLSKFRTQLNSLMTSIDGTKTRYIRCIKPNGENKPQVMDHKGTLSQLESAGIVTAIVITRESFPKSMTYEMIQQRFYYLVPSSGASPDDDIKAVKAKAVEIVKQLLPMESNGEHTEYPWRSGKTKVFFRTGALEQMESKLQAYVNNFVIRIQSWIRSILSKLFFRSVRAKIIKLQAICRGKVVRAQYKKQIEAILILQRAFRCAIARRRLSRAREEAAAVSVQSRWRAYLGKRHWLKVKAATKRIQRIAKSGMRKDRFKAKMFEVVKAAKLDNDRYTMQKQIREAAASKQPVEAKLVNDVELLYSDLLREVAELRRKNIDLSCQLSEALAQNRSHEAQMFVAKSEASAANNHVNRMSVIGRTNAVEMIKKNAQIALIKKERKESEERLKNEKKELIQKHKEESSAQESEISNLTSLLMTEKKERLETEEKLKSEMQLQQANSSEIILKLKNELRETEVSHNEYLAKLMDVLESAHKRRQSDLQKQLKEIESVKAAKDAEIFTLRTEVLKLKGSKGGGSPEIDKLIAENEALKKKLEINKRQIAMGKSRTARIGGLGQFQSDD